MAVEDYKQGFEGKTIARDMGLIRYAPGHPGDHSSPGARLPSRPSANPGDFFNRSLYLPSRPHLTSASSHNCSSERYSARGIDALLTEVPMPLSYLLNAQTFVLIDQDKQHWIVSANIGKFYYSSHRLC